MRPQELWARIGSQCGIAVLSLRHRLGLTPAVSEQSDFRRYRFCTAQTSVLPARPSEALDEHMVERVLAGGLPQIGWNWTWRDESDTWHRDRQTGILWPRRFFNSISYREGNPYGDVRCLWEPSRLQQLVILGMIAACEGNPSRDRALKMLEAQFLSWVDANPLYTGPHYISAMECALRLIAVCHTFDQVRMQITDPERIWISLVQLVEGHAALIRQRMSLHSSLGNHTIAEAAALVYAGVLFPEMPQAAEWESIGLWVLESEAGHQILADGGGIEQGFWYLKFISDLYGLTADLLAHHGRSVPAKILQAIRRSRSFLSAMADSDGRLPSIGDSDDGYALTPLLGIRHDVQEGKALSTFASSGYSIIHGKGRVKTTLMFDHGSLGMAPCFAHGHADALSVALREDREDILVDPGTFVYSGKPEWRAYFRGTRAHNTVAVDSLDQAVQETPFQWSSSFSARLVSRREAKDGQITLIAMHDGYVRRCGVHHWRGVLSNGDGLWVIVDMLTGQGAHALELNWHLGRRPVVQGTEYVLPGLESKFCLSATGGTHELIRAGDNASGGWRSSFYGVREPLDTLRVRYHGTLPHHFVTCITERPIDENVRLSAMSLLKGLIDEARTH
ncbi:hypothetical protein W02_42690 [Nitrospira sp. KM1]|nr:hypothetical protein W02_42690 [Nitrospira sp. KM1]